MVIAFGYMTNVADDATRRFAETMLYWRGRLRISEVQDFAGVSERTARAWVGRWRGRGLLPLFRQNRYRALLPVEGFDPGTPASDLNRALSLLVATEESPGNPFASVAPAGAGHDLLISGRMPRGPTRAMVGAYLDRQPVELLYAAKSGLQEFVFFPAALVRTRGRFHFRGYRTKGCELRGAALEERFVDVVPARSVEAHRLEGGDDVEFVGLDADREWNEFESEKFRLSAELTQEERLCYEHQYGIADKGVLKMRERRALMVYIRQELAERRCWRRDGASVPVWRIPGYSGNPDNTE